MWRRSVEIQSNDTRRRVIAMPTEPSPATRRACVIGAGISGLVTAKVLLADGFHVELFEKQSDLGGTWHPDRTYPGLRTNDPGAVYCFSDVPYPDTADAFPTAEQVREYLHDYADRFGLGFSPSSQQKRPPMARRDGSM